MRTLDDYIRRYEEKTGEKFEPKAGFKLFFLPGRGFCEFRVEENMVMIYQLSGDGKFWRDFSRVLARMCGCKHMGAICARANILAYIRFWGYRIEREETLPDGERRFYCREVHTGKSGLVSPAWTDASGKTGYFVTWEV